MTTRSYTVPGSIADLFAPRKRLTLSIPLDPHTHAELDVPHPMTEEHWQQLLAVLDAMKPGLVREGAAAAGKDGEA